MRLLTQSAGIAVALAMAVSAQSTVLPNLSTATQTTASASASSTATAASATSSAAGTTTTGSGSTATTSVATITGTASATTGGGLTGLPTLSGAVQAFTVSVPNLSNAPFMQTSSLPDGTVFIVVGAVLGFMALSVLLWRCLVAWALHRSVKRAANHHPTLDDKAALFRNPGPAPTPFYKYSDRDSTASLSGLGPRPRKGDRPKTGASDRASLFFSPTAGAAGGGAGNRGSSYLPAGYYAAGASAPNNGSGQVAIGGYRQDISMSTLRPESQGYGRARSMGHSPPDSPSVSAERGGHMASSSTLNLNQGYGGNERAPSAYLEDLIDGDNTVPPGHGHLRDHSNSPAGNRF